MNHRSRKNKTKNKLARLFMTHNLSDNNVVLQQINYNLGERVQNGTITDAHEIITATMIINDLFNEGRLTKDEHREYLTNFAQSLSGFKVVSK